MVFRASMSLALVRAWAVAAAVLMEAAVAGAPPSAGRIGGPATSGANSQNISSLRARSQEKENHLHVHQDHLSG